jgi:shikimate dehydrogenase
MDYNGVYLPMKVCDLAEGVRGLRALGFTGVSVTVPHKEKIIPLIDEVDSTAKEIGAVNTLLFVRDEGDKKTIIRGFNTDWLGSNMALSLKGKIDLRGSRILVLGAGGAARGVCFGLVKAGAEVIITNRSVEKGQLLADWLGCEFVAAQELAHVQADALVNTTSVGMEPGIDTIPIDPDLLPNFSVVMDIVYAPLETRLLKEAKLVGCRTVDGLSMLLFQATAQLEIWTGRRAPLEVMRQALR